MSAFLCDKESQHQTGKPIGSRVTGPGGGLTGLVIVVWCWIMESLGPALHSVPPGAGVDASVTDSPVTPELILLSNEVTILETKTCFSTQTFKFPFLDDKILMTIKHQ